MLKKYNYNILSKYRTELMGVAILWVMFFHSTISINNIIFRLIKHIGYGGVDIFLMLSGLGLYYAYKKNNDMLEFYKRRVLRILPTYLPVVVVYCTILYIHRKISLNTLIMNITTLSFWFNSSYRFDWYIPATIMLYLFSPIVLKRICENHKNQSKHIIIVLCILVSILVSILVISLDINYLLILTSRIPIFCIGIIIGDYSFSEKEMNNKHFIIHLLMFTIGIILLMFSIKFLPNCLWKYGLWWWPFIFITIPICIMISIFFDYIDRNKFNKFGILKFCGNHSLELYLFHERILSLIGGRLEDLGALNMNLICISITFFMAATWKKIINFIAQCRIRKNLCLNQNS